MLSEAKLAFQSKLNAVLGAVLWFSILISLIISIPIYIFRQFVIVLAKLFRPDLATILDGQATHHCNDYFAKTPPRENIVVTMIVQGQITLEELRLRALKCWIKPRDQTTGQLVYAKFQQYPVPWLGFTFWKIAADTFSINNHVHCASSMETTASEEDLNDLVEKLLNAPLPRNQSPWELHVIENYKSAKDPHQPMSVLVFKVHHCLADGYSILTALVEGLSGSSLSSVPSPAPKPVEQSIVQKIRQTLSIPIQLALELSQIFSYQFRESPWKIQDKEKAWYQVCTQSEPISIQVIKDIKNHHGVTFTSVLLSAISSAIYKSLEETSKRKGRNNRVDSMLFMSTLPVFTEGKGKDRKLTVYVTGALFDIPTKKFPTPLDRLRNIDKKLEETKRSVVPTVVYYLLCMGTNFTKVSGAQMKNRMISTGLTNFPSVPMVIDFNGKPVIDVDFRAGGMDGVAGVGIMVLSYNEQIRVGVTAEKALMSRSDAKQFVNFITEEIELLQKTIKK